MSRSLVVAMVLVAVAGCTNATTDLPEAYTVSHVSVGDTVRLRLGEAAAVDGSDIVIRFSEIEADTRCPIDVVCVWAGDAHVRLDLIRGGTTIVRADLHTGDEPRTVRHEDLVFRLVDVAPARTTGRSIADHEYSIGILVARG